MIEAFAPAKINLTLHVTGRRDDGYHLLDSLVVFGDIGDRLAFEPAAGLSLNVTGPFAQGVPTDASNLVMKAARLLHPDLGAAISLEKNLPHGAGIGGGSSDAAATLRALAELWSLPEPSAAQALTLGADLPVCLQAPHASIMSGIGEITRPAPPLPAMWIVLVNPGISVSTGKIFAALADSGQIDNPAMDNLPADASEDEFWVWLSGQRNDLTHCTCEFVPEIAQIIATLWDFDTCLDADMSGSGSTCRGIFATQRDANDAARSIRDACPDWWVEVTKVS